MAFGEVYCGYVPGLSQSIQQFVHTGHGMAVEGGDIVQLSEVVAEAKSVIGLGDHHVRAGPGAA